MARFWVPAGGVLLIVFCLGLPPTSHADMDRTQREIQHLMDYIAGSECRFIRNGKVYGAESALAHIQRKYGHVRPRVRTAEDFIDYAATRSSMSGKPYRVQCGNETLLCGDWLRAELARRRQQE